MAVCDVQPASAFYSTHLNPRINSFESLTNRIVRQLGSPLVTIEQHRDQIYEFISIATEFFSKFTYTEEYLVFKSDIYTKGYGLEMEKVLTSEQTSLSTQATFEDDLLLTKRKVIDVFAFEEGESTGVNTLFTIEQTLAQQTYFSYSMGNYGYDLVSWYTLKEWLETREKLLSTRRTYKFNEDLQLLTIYPEPRSDVEFFGVVGLYLEKPLKSILKEPWVYQYALALTKMSLGHVRGKYGNVKLFGGGTLTVSDIMTQGLAEQQALEKQMLEGAPGFGDTAPPQFFVG